MCSTMAAEIVAFVCVPYLLQVLFGLCLVFVMITMAPPPSKRMRVVLTLEKKREIIEKMDAGWTISRISQTYEVPATTLYDLRRNKNKIIRYEQDFG